MVVYGKINEIKLSFSFDEKHLYLAWPFCIFAEICCSLSLSGLEGLSEAIIILQLLAHSYISRISGLHPHDSFPIVLLAHKANQADDSDNISKVKQSKCQISHEGNGTAIVFAGCDGLLDVVELVDGIELDGRVGILHKEGFVLDTDWGLYWNYVVDQDTRDLGV